MNTAGLYRVFVVIYGIFAVVVSIIILFGIKTVPHIPSENPFYTESINYPPGGAEKVALAAFLISSFAYLLLDCLFMECLVGHKKILWIFLGAFFILISIEASIRCFTERNPPLHRPHPVYLWELFPNHHERTMLGGAVKRLDVNSLGFRGPEVLIKKPEGTFRILILGDSSAFGYGTAQNEVFSHILQKELAKRDPGKIVEVINGAVPGYTTFSSMRVFQGKGAGLNPDMVIVAHNNDPDLDWEMDKNRASRGVIAELKRVLYKSDLYMLLRKIILNTRLKKRQFLYNRPPEGKGIHRVSPEDLKSNLETIASICQKKRAHLVIISMPRMEDEDDKIKLYRGIMKKSAKNARGTFIDLFKKWGREDCEGLFIDDMHPNAAGHKKIAREVAETIIIYVGEKNDRKDIY